MITRYTVNCGEVSYTIYNGFGVWCVFKHSYTPHTKFFDSEQEARNFVLEDKLAS